jgi:hypothetical protein
MLKPRNLIPLVLLTVLFLAPLQSKAGVRVYVRFGPPHLRTVKVVKPLKPYPRAVWISGHWAFRSGRYIWVNGYWVKPRARHVYVPGHWEKSPRGWYFVAGRWVKK